jgi:hypothetical protein
LYVAAAGNGGRDRVGDNNDNTANYPSNYDTSAAAGYDAVVAVTALTSTGALASFSNYGVTMVDLAAPGAGITSTLPGNQYGDYSGTSMATAHVSGAIALYAAANPNASAADIKAALLSSTAATASVSGRTETGGRLDVTTFLATTTPPEPNSVFGTSVSETLYGTSGRDILSGVAASGSFLGTSTVDRLYGRGGNDVFVLGDSRGVFYNDWKSTTVGTRDYGQIMDFQPGDKIQLSDDVRSYFFKSVKIGGSTGTGIYADLNQNGSFDRYDERFCFRLKEPIGFLVRRSHQNIWSSALNTGLVVATRTPVWRSTPASRAARAGMATKTISKSGTVLTSLAQSLAARA